MALSTTSQIPIAILDDYQQVALTSADWSSLKDRITPQVYTDTLLDEDELVKRLYPYTIICAMRERTKFSSSLIDKLPNLRFIATTGGANRGIDVAYAKSKGVVVSGTGGKGNSTLEHIWALILGTARYIAQEDANAKAAKIQWQTFIPMALAGKTLGLVGAGHLGAATAKVSVMPRI